MDNENRIRYFSRLVREIDYRLNVINGNLGVVEETVNGDLELMAAELSLQTHRPYEEILNNSKKNFNAYVVIRKNCLESIKVKLEDLREDLVSLI